MPGTPRCTFLISFSKDRKLVASSHVNHSINISRLATGEHIQTLTGHPRSPWCVTFHPSSNEILASGCLGGEVRVWDLQVSVPLKPYTDRTNSIDHLLNICMVLSNYSIMTKVQNVKF